MAYTVLLDVKEYYANKPTILKTKQQIRDYMFRWIDHGGKVCIFSNDLSWIDDEEMKVMLRRKASKNELTICIPAMIPIAESFAELGATIHTYSFLKMVPQSRFTIINCGRMDARIAVGRRMNGDHAIEEFGAGGHPVFAVASDLVELIARYNTTRLNS